MIPSHIFIVKETSPPRAAAAAAAVNVPAGRSGLEKSLAWMVVE